MVHVVCVHAWCVCMHVVCAMVCMVHVVCGVHAWCVCMHVVCGVWCVVCMACSAHGVHNYLAWVGSWVGMGLNAGSLKNLGKSTPYGLQLGHTGTMIKV